MFSAFPLPFNPYLIWKKEFVIQYTDINVCKLLITSGISKSNKVQLSFHIKKDLTGNYHYMMDYKWISFMNLNMAV